MLWYKIIKARSNKKVNVAGRKSEDDYTIYYLPIDKVYSDVMLVIFTLLMVFMGKVISGVKNQHFDYASLIMTAAFFPIVYCFICCPLSYSLLPRPPSDSVAP